MAISSLCDSGKLAPLVEKYPHIEAVLMDDMTSVLPKKRIRG